MLAGPDFYLTISDFAIHEAGSILRWATSQGYSMATGPTALARPYLHFQISQEKKDFANLMAESKAFRAELALNGPHPKSSQVQCADLLRVPGVKLQGVEFNTTMRSADAA